MPIQGLEATRPVDLDTGFVRPLDVAELEFELPPLPDVRQVPEFVRVKVQLGYRVQSWRAHSDYELARPGHDQLPVMQSGQDYDEHVEDPGRDVADPEVVDDFADLRPARECLGNREQGLACHDAGHRHQQQ